MQVERTQIRAFRDSPSPTFGPTRSRFFGRGCDEALVGEKWGFQRKGWRHSVNEGFGKDLYRKGSSVTRSGPSSELLDSEK